MLKPEGLSMILILVKSVVSLGYYDTIFLLHLKHPES